MKLALPDLIAAAVDVVALHELPGRGEVDRGVGHLLLEGCADVERICDGQPSALSEIALRAHTVEDTWRAPT